VCLVDRICLGCLVFLFGEPDKPQKPKIVPPTSSLPRVAAETILSSRMPLGYRFLSSRLMAADAACFNGDRLMDGRTGNHGIAIFGRGQERYTDHHRQGKHDKEPINFS
jgi:hypothetical protein